ncbi:MAG: hypothetical protein ABJ387_03505 [Balneola sp.]
MPLADSDSIKEFGFVKQKIADKAVKFANRAEKQLRGWISDDVYDALEDEPVNKALVKQSESILALALSLPQLNMRFSELGGLSKIIGIPGETSEELMSFRELRTYGEELKKQAFELIDVLIPDLATDPDSFESAGFSVMASTNFADPS